MAHRSMSVQNGSLTPSSIQMLRILLHVLGEHLVCGTQGTWPEVDRDRGLTVGPSTAGVILAVRHRLVARNKEPVADSCVTDANEVVPVTRPALALPPSSRTVDANCRRHFQERMVRWHEGWQRHREQEIRKMRRGTASDRTGKMGSPVGDVLKRTSTCGRVVLSGADSGSHRVQRHSGSGRTRRARALPQ